MDRRSGTGSEARAPDLRTSTQSSGPAPSPRSRAAIAVREVAVPGAIPRVEIPGWRERFGVVAGITGRGEELPGRGFDLGLWTDAPVGEVMSRWRAFRSAEPGFPSVALGNQVHGTEILHVSGGLGQVETGNQARAPDRRTVCWSGGLAPSPDSRAATASGWLQIDGIDGWTTTTPGTLLTVTVADCIPVYLVAPGRGVALLHAGWRGTAAGILQAGIERLRAATGCVASDIVMHCGVGICGDCYEVGSEVMSGCGLAADGSGPWHLDLRAYLVDRAQHLGIREVTVSPWCSAHDRPKFYSHRASRGTDGRMVAYLGLCIDSTPNPR